MSDLEVICPACGATISLSDALTKQLQEWEQRMHGGFLNV